MGFFLFACFEFQIWKKLKNHVAVTLSFLYQIHSPMLDWYQQQEHIYYRWRINVISFYFGRV